MVFNKFTSFVAFVAFAAASFSTSNSMPHVDSGVHRVLRKQGTVNLIVTMKENPKKTLESFQEMGVTSRGERIAKMVQQLENNALISQKPVKAILSYETASNEPLYKSSKSFWISNQVYIEGASDEVVNKLSTLPSVLEVREEQILPLPRTFIASAVDAANTTATVEWGIEKVKANDVWTSGHKGENVLVSSIDTGVLGTHEALESNFRGEYGWFDPEKKAAAPYDPNGHGTHTMGTIAGSHGIGVAPGAKWMACKGCRSDGCSESDLLTCAQFITCPTDTSGNNKDCSKAPHVVSNSWGGGQGETFYQNAVDTWIKAGIIPVFANGNSGPDCGTANSPGDYANVIAVGATDVSDGLASFSSKGPAKSGLLKPDISAPGANIRSAWNSGDTSYNSISGTSMATPHVTGCVALLLSSKAGLTYEDVKKTLTSTTDTNLKSAGKTCGGTPDSKFPNNNYGYGRINVLNAIKGDFSEPSSSPISPIPTSTPTQKPTQKPTPTPKPSKCSELDFDECHNSLTCYWSWGGATCMGY